jgi:methionine sulfoxide reductase heme-binding subunit
MAGAVDMAPEKECRWGGCNRRITWAQGGTGQLAPVRWTTQEATIPERSARRRDLASPALPTLGTGRSFRRRLLFHHVPIALASVGLLLLFTGLSVFPNSFSHEGGSRGAFSFALDPSNRSFGSWLTIATGYLATALLAVTLLVGPLNLLLRRANPLSNYLRRDLGTWVVIFGALHVVLAFREAYRGVFSFLGFFITDGAPITTSFGVGNWTGLAALAIATGLLAISTTHSVRELGPARWKSLQRLNYTVFGLVLLHATCYGALQRTSSPFTILLFSIAATVMLGQLMGIWLSRSRKSRPARRASSRVWRATADASAAE